MEAQKIVKLGDRDVSCGWAAELTRLDNDVPHRVVDHTEAVRAVARFLDFEAVPNADWAAMVQDQLTAHDHEQLGDETPEWIIPLTLDRMTELVIGGGLIEVEFDGYEPGTRYQVYVDVN